MAKLVGTPPLTKYSKTSPTVNRNFVIHIYQVNSNFPPPPPPQKKEIFPEISEHFLNTRQH